MEASIVITTYNRNEYLPDAIKSVLNQTYQDFEIIVVDDDPRSNIIENIVHSFHDSRLKYIKNQVSVGGAKSLNTGIKSAQGTYIAILDDDDIWISTDKLEKQVGFLNNNPHFVIVGASSININAKTGAEISRYTKMPDENKLKKTILLNVPFAHSSVLYRKDSALAVGGYDENLVRAKDMDLFLKLYSLGKFGFISDTFIQYRVDTNKSLKEVIKSRAIDAYYQQYVIKSYKKQFPGYFTPLVKITTRLIIFKILQVFPFIYKVYRVIKDR
jgi:glycosyltransferase involved in cell wall biosynthesis